MISAFSRFSPRGLGTCMHVMHGPDQCGCMAWDGALLARAHRAAVVNVQFGINESECFGLLGSNGAGKTTTSACRARARGFLRRTSG